MALKELKKKFSLSLSFTFNVLKKTSTIFIVVDRYMLHDFKRLDFERNSE